MVGVVSDTSDLLFYLEVIAASVVRLGKNGGRFAWYASEDLHHGCYYLIDRRKDY